MKLSTLIFLFLISSSVHGQSLRQQLLKTDTLLHDVRIIPCKADPTLFIAILVTSSHWWETISVVKFENNKIIWTAVFDSLPTSQSILSARQISLKGIPGIFIEVFDETHKGNGYYYLYKLYGKQLNTMVSTRAADYNDDGAVEINHKFYSRYFKTGQLTPVYTDINNDGFADIIIKGTIQIKGDNYLKEYPAKKVFVYNKVKNRFVEDLKLRKGFKPEDD